MTQRTPPGGSIWNRPARATRGPVPEHSRAEIAAAGIAIADSDGLSAVTMRSVAAAIETGPASLYRYVANRGELLELMADQVRGELNYAPAAGPPAARLLALARAGREMYLRHPWLLELHAAPIPGPNALAFIEHSLAALADTEMTGPARLETVGLFSGAVRLTAQIEIDQLRAGQDAARWRADLAAYLTEIVSTAQHPHLAAALADASTPAELKSQQDAFDYAITRILAGLLSAGESSPRPRGLTNAPAWRSTGAEPDSRTASPPAC